MKKKKDKRGHRYRLPVELEHKLPEDVLRHIYSFLYTRSPSLFEKMQAQLDDIAKRIEEIKQTRLIVQELLNSAGTIIED